MIVPASVSLSETTGPGSGESCPDNSYESYTPSTPTSEYVRRAIRRENPGPSTDTSTAVSSAASRVSAAPSMWVARAAQAPQKKRPVGSESCPRSLHRPQALSVSSLSSHRGCRRRIRRRAHRRRSDRRERRRSHPRGRRRSDSRQRRRRREDSRSADRGESCGPRHKRGKHLGASCDSRAERRLPRRSLSSPRVHLRSKSEEHIVAVYNRPQSPSSCAPSPADDTCDFGESCDAEMNERGESCAVSLPQPSVPKPPPPAVPLTGSAKRRARRLLVNRVTGVPSERLLKRVRREAAERVHGPQAPVVQ